MSGETTLELTRYIRPNDRIIWGQLCAEPQTLTELLVAQRHRLGGVSCFLGMPATDTIRPEHADTLTLTSYCGTGANRRLHDAGVLEIAPVHYSSLRDLLGGGGLAIDVVLFQVSAPDENGRHSLGLCDDFFSAVLDTARVVIAEVNDQVPFTVGARTLTADQWTVAICTSRPPLELMSPEPSVTMRAVATQVAALVPDGATLQFGIGALPAACLDALAGHRDLGIHSGLLDDAAMRLIRAGVVTGSHKSVDRGRAVAGLLSGSRELFRFAHRNETILMRNTAYTHDAQVLAAQHQLVAINSAIEVDLTGQVNAEVARGQYVGAIGGAVDFQRGATASKGGIPIVALPSTAGAASRIVAQLSGPVSTARSDTGVVVTEHGAADLRGLTLSARAERMIGIAHPDHRVALAAGFEEQLMNGVRA